MFCIRMCSNHDFKSRKFFFGPFYGDGVSFFRRNLLIWCKRLHVVIVAPAVHLSPIFLGDQHFLSRGAWRAGYAGHQCSVRFARTRYVLECGFYACTWVNSFNNSHIFPLSVSSSFIILIISVEASYPAFTALVSWLRLVPCFLYSVSSSRMGGGIRDFGFKSCLKQILLLRQARSSYLFPNFICIAFIGAK